MGHTHSHGESHSAKEHKSHAPVQVATYVVTCSDSRSSAADESGRAIQDALRAAGHPLAGYRVVRDEPEEIRQAVAEAKAAGARALILNTVEVLERLFEKTLPGFGELFRSLSFQEIGSAAMMSRAVAGTYQGMMIFALPGSPQAVQLALDRLILPELGHTIRELTR